MNFLLFPWRLAFGVPAIALAVASNLLAYIARGASGPRILRNAGL